MAPLAILSDAEMAMVRNSPLFHQLSDASIQAVLVDAFVLDVPAKRLMFSRGDPADRMFVLLSGRVKLFVMTPDGREAVVDFVNPGMSFAEAAVFGLPRMPVSAEAAADSRLLVVPQAPVVRRILDDPDFGLLLMASLAAWKRRLIARVADFKLHTPTERLVAALLARAPAADGAVTIRLDQSKLGIASHIGVSPESLSRALARLRSHGVTIDGRDVVIADVSRLRQLHTDMSATPPSPARQRRAARARQP